MFTSNEIESAKIEHRYAEENQTPCKVRKASPELLEKLYKKLGPVEKKKCKEREFQMNLQKKTENNQNFTYQG